MDSERDWRCRYPGTFTQEIKTPADGARALISAVLILATKDVQKDKQYGEDALAFINSAWCSELCDGIDVSYSDYLRAVEKASGGKLYLS